MEKYYLAVLQSSRTCQADFVVELNLSSFTVLRNEKLEENLNFQLREREKKMEIAKSKLENYSKLLTSIKTGVEHLMEKLKNINIVIL